MPQKIRTSIIVILTIINIIGVIFIFITISSYEANSHKYERKLSKINKNDNNNNINILKYLKINNSTKLNQSKKSSYSPSFASSSFYSDSILLLNYIFLYFCINLLISFAIGESECYNCNCCACCSCCCRGGCGGNCDCNCNNVRNGNEIIICIVFMIIIFILYYSVKICGKHLSRFISLSFIIIINSLIIFISLAHLNEDSNIIKCNLLISTFLFICNLLGFMLPNFKKCENLRYKSVSHVPMINSQHQSSNANGYFPNNNYYNGNVSPNVVYAVPIVNNEYNVYPQTNSTTVSTSICSLNNNSENSGNQNLMNSGNLGIPPLPTEIELPSEKEVYSQKTNE